LPPATCNPLKFQIPNPRAEIHHSPMPRPWISTNLAISADGKISSVARRPSGWTSRADHDRLLELRNCADALIVGRGTLEADRMTLTAPGKSVPPLRCVVSRKGRLRADLPLFLTPGGPIHLLVTGGTTPDLPAEVTIHHGSLAGFLEKLATDLGVKHLHCEGGGGLIRSLAEMGAIDEFHLTLAGHKLFGGADAPTATGIPGDFLPSSQEFTLSHFEPRPDLGECFLTYRRDQ
jgi:2,5-diamino-6-(ribosylamino)-4(3H)-pyrimidinone 5'-phosphate reductase